MINLSCFMIRFMGTVCDTEHWTLVGRQKYRGHVLFLMEPTSADFE